jgi:hypothetical protein
VVLALALAGCNARERIERKVWNLFGIREALDVQAAVAVSPTLPAGIPASEFLTPNASQELTLKVQPAFAEGQPAAYVTTEIWVNYYDAIWLQPLYSQVADLGPPPVRVADAPGVIDVGPESTFYSPFWQVSWAVVGDVPPDRYQSSKELLDAASQIVPAGMKTCPLRPLDVVGRGLTLPVPWTAWNLTLQEVPMSEVVFEEEGDVETLGIFDFGHNLFELEVENHGAVVEPRRMFVFTKPDGTLALNEPRVLGAGDFGGDATEPRPRFGGLWRLIKVVLPGSAEAFHASKYPDAAMHAAGDPLDYEGRFALDSACFQGTAANNFPNDCVWLDSQGQLETILGAAHLVATEIMQTGPLVLYNKQAVPVND